MIVEDLVHDEEVVREAAAEALAAAIEKNRDQVECTLSQLLELYEDKLYVSTCATAFVL